MHTVRDREKLIARVRRIRGQIEGIERALTEDHVRYHVLDPEERAAPKRARAAEELIDIVRAYVK
jgi:DNA-binding FrmR family transcriptional regulator